MNELWADIVRYYTNFGNSGIDTSRLFACLDMISERQLERVGELHTPHQARMEAILTEMAEIRLAKVKEYGESRYQEQDVKFNQLMCFSDIHRKYIRARQQALNLPAGEPETFEALRETYIDLAVYAIMAIQLIDQDKERLCDEQAEVQVRADCVCAEESSEGETVDEGSGD